jgi:hypothetical protein
MVGMPEMQEHFPAMTMDGWYAGNAGAFSPHSCGSKVHEHFFGVSQAMSRQRLLRGRQQVVRQRRSGDVYVAEQTVPCRFRQALAADDQLAFGKPREQR